MDVHCLTSLLLFLVLINGSLGISPFDRFWDRFAPATATDIQCDYDRSCQITLRSTKSKCHATGICICPASTMYDPIANRCYEVWCTGFNHNECGDGQKCAFNLYCVKNREAASCLDDTFCLGDTICISGRCLNTADNGEECSHDKQCSERDPRSKCSGNRCSCQTGYIFDKDFNSCRPQITLTKLEPSSRGFGKISSVTPSRRDREFCHPMLGNICGAGYKCQNFECIENDLKISGPKRFQTGANGIMKDDPVVGKAYEKQQTADMTLGHENSSSFNLLRDQGPRGPSVNKVDITPTGKPKLYVLVAGILFVGISALAGVLGCVKRSREIRQAESNLNDAVTRNSVIRNRGFSNNLDFNTQSLNSDGSRRIHHSNRRRGTDGHDNHMRRIRNGCLSIISDEMVKPPDYDSVVKAYPPPPSFESVVASMTSCQSSAPNVTMASCPTYSSSSNNNSDKN